MKYGKKFWIGLIGGLPAGLIGFEALRVAGVGGLVILLVYHWSMSCMDGWWDECANAGVEDRLKKSAAV